MPCCILCCLPAFQAVLKRFRRVSAILLFHCYEKDKAEQWFPECPSLETNNSAGKLPPATIPPELQSRDVAVPCPFTRFAIPPTDHSLAMLLFLARPASEFQTRLVQTVVDPFTDRVVCRVTKISPARVASGANGFVFCLLQAASYLVFLLAVEQQNSANSPKTLQNGLERGQTTKNTTRQ